MIFILIVYYLECQEDAERLNQCLSHLPMCFPHLVIGHACPPLYPGPGIALAANVGKATAANLGLHLVSMIYGTIQVVMVADGDIILPLDASVYLEEAERVLAGPDSEIDVLVPDQKFDRRHSSNVPQGSKGITSLPSAAGLAGGCMLFKARHRFPVLGPGYQPEDVFFLKDKRAAIWPAFQVAHPYVASEPLRARQRLRFGFSPAPC